VTRAGSLPPFYRKGNKGHEMKSNYKNRIAAVAAELVGLRAPLPPPPFFVWSGETTPEAIRAARKQGRAIVYVTWLSEDRAEVVVDNVPDYVAWATLQDTRMSIKRLHVNLAKGELEGPYYTEWTRPELGEERENRDEYTR